MAHPLSGGKKAVTPTKAPAASPQSTAVSAVLPASNAEFSVDGAHTNPHSDLIIAIPAKSDVS
jgi:hypothetical protein